MLGAEVLKVVGAFDLNLATRVVFGEGALGRLGELARELAFRRTLIVADRGIVSTGQVKRAAVLLQASGAERALQIMRHIDGSCCESISARASFANAKIQTD